MRAPRVFNVLRMPWRERWVVLQVLWLLVAIRVGLLVLPFPQLWQILERLGGHGARRSDEDPKSVERLLRIVTIVSEHLRGSKCLDRALAAKVLLSRRGRPVDLRIGVVLGEDRELTAHAWLEADGTVVIGQGESLDRYTPLPTLAPGELLTRGGE